jgi:GT2 family glycosyltransferase
MNAAPPRIGVVVIGRNEGARLEACLRGLLEKRDETVYVDSASTDQSVALARALQFHVVELDALLPLNAARARNAGFLRLRQILPGLRYVQFLDGDCELDPDWIPTAQAWLESHPQTVAVCGRRRECFVERSLYNKLCDIEWDTPVGEARSFGGDAFIRAAAFSRSGGYNEGFPAGEEPDLCLRLRRKGGTIMRLPVEMTRHDANILTFRAWWLRSVRGGYGAALVLNHWRKRSEGVDIPFQFMSRSAVLWTDGWLLCSLAFLGTGIFFAGAWGALGAVFAAVSLWMLQVLRVANGQWGKTSARDALLYGFFTMVGKWPQRFGQNLLRRDTRGKIPLRSIEYKA